jgi:hypothetical protein
VELIEQYRTDDKGYHPFLIRDGWQVAQLNYIPDQDMYNIDKLEVHRRTDEVFVLLKGKAVLIGATFQDGSPDYVLQPMEPRVAYNVVMNSWHNIVMMPGSEILIVEKSNTHKTDVEYRALSMDQQKDLFKQISVLFPPDKTDQAGGEKKFR